MAVTIKRFSDVFIALFVVAIAAMLLIPLPTPLLSFLLVVNICFSILVLLVGLYTPNVLSLLSFPTILLLTTLFRLSLNVASARLILTQGDAGSVIRAFGTFLIRGEIIVGVVIFAIITIVNFIVIARGASRVSEVAARFALDALPGKQMAIDSDLRSGSISQVEAQQKREELRRESQLFGAMDGSMKFVQGDAIAGIFIIITNIVGGIYLGVSRGMDFSEAVDNYTVLTVGDGLVTQIPALLISICAGIVVTRVASAEGATLGSDMSAQIFARPGLIAVSGIFLMALGALSGLPIVPFAGVGLLFLALGYFLSKRGAVGGLYSLSTAPALSLPGGVGALPAPDRGALDIEPGEAVIGLESDVLYRVFEANTPRMAETIKLFREEFFKNTGLPAPLIAIVPKSLGRPGAFALDVNGLTADSGSVPLDAILAETSPAAAESLGLEVVDGSAHPLNGAEAAWVRSSQTSRRILEAGSCRQFDFFDYILLRLQSFLVDNPEELLGLTEVHALLKAAERRSPGLVSEVFSANFVSVPKLTETLQRLVREGVSLRDLRSVLELVSSFCSENGITPSDDSGFNQDEFISFYRVARRRQVVAQSLSRRRSLKVLTLDPSVESVFEDAGVANASAIALSSDSMDTLRKSLQELAAPVLRRGQMPLSILCRQDLRAAVVRFVRGAGLRLNVIGTDELEPQSVLEHVGIWAI